MDELTYPIRINRYLALRNICSRREADVLIAKKIVKINGRIAKLGDKVNADAKVEVDLKQKNILKKYQYFTYNKPVGVVTHSPEPGQKDIREATALPKGFFPVGRLDKDSHGLIILTNDGRVTDKLLNPEYSHEREYIVRVNKPITNIFLKVLQKGIQLEDFKTKPAKVTKISQYVFSIVLVEGKKHQIRRMCTNFGFEAVDLQRTRIMEIKLENLGVGKKRELIGEELNNFLKKLQC